jgi:hypothetical protein
VRIETVAGRENPTQGKEKERKKELAQSNT